MTKGSTKAVMVPSPSSNHASVYRAESMGSEVALGGRSFGSDLLDPHKGDAGGEQQDPDQQVLELLQDQLPQRLSCRRENVFQDRD